MLTAISELGKVWERKDIEALVDRSNAKQILVMRIRVIGKDVKYEGMSIEEKKAEKRYLYRRDLSGIPGLFLTGKIGVIDVHNFKKSLSTLESQGINEKEEAEKQVYNFIWRKVERLLICKAVKLGNRKTILGELWDSRLENIIREIKDNIPEIRKDIIRLIKPMNPQELLLTVKLVENSRQYHLGEIPQFVELFKHAVTGTKQRKKREKRLATTCSICNKASVTEKFKEPPIAFFTVDKPSFIPDGDRLQDYKVLPICVNCYMNLRRGQVFIQENLDFYIPNIGSDRPIIRFWLIPVLNDTASLKEFVENLGVALYFKNLARIFETMDLITKRDVKRPYFESFLSFNAIFYSFDRQKHMKLISSVHGIYPSRLREIVAAKEAVDSTYPFYRHNIRFGFPLLCKFMEFDQTNPLPTAIASITSNIFLNKPIDSSYIFEILSKRINDSCKKRLDLKELTTICLNALITIDYLLNLEIVKLGEQEPLETSLPSFDDPTVKEIKKFLDEHSKLMYTGTLRAICATGIATGILLEVQKSSPTGSTPFWNRVNRLEMNLNRVKSLFPQVVNKFYQYRDHTYDAVLSYLGIEIANLNPNEMALSNELISLVFAVGLSEGYLVSRKMGEE